MVLQLPASLVSTIQSSQLQLLEDVHADDSNFSFDYDEFLLGQQQQPPHSMVDGDYAWLLNIEVPLGAALCGVLCMGFMLFKGISVGIRVTVKDLKTGTFEYIDATTVMGLHPDSILGRRRQYYRLWTHLFLHSDRTHLLHNMLGLLQWGPRAENLVGTLRLLETSLFWAVALEFVWLVILTRIVPGLGDSPQQCC